MRTIQASEAKAKLLKILDDVEGGQTFQVTRHGRKIARIVPEPDDETYIEQARRAFETIQEIRKRVKPISLAQILADKNEGRM
jgi:prevent-host-death family protein